MQSDTSCHSTWCLSLAAVTSSLRSFQFFCQNQPYMTLMFAAPARSSSSWSFFAFPPTISANRKQSETGWITRIQSTGLELVAEPVLRWQRRSEPVDRLPACVGGNAERQPRKRRSRRGWSSCSTGYRIWADASALNAVFPGTESSWNHKSHQCATKKITRAAEQRPAFDICDVWSLNLGWNFNYKSRTRLSNCFVLERWEIARESLLQLI